LVIFYIYLMEGKGRSPEPYIMENTIGELR